MQCPACNNVNLAMTDRQGIEIDYCPECRGIWLDRGELDRLIERAEPSASTSSAPYREHTSHGGQRYPDARHDDHRYNERQHKRRKSLLGELFDF